MVNESIDTRVNDSNPGIMYTIKKGIENGAIEGIFSIMMVGTGAYIGYKIGLENSHVAGAALGATIGGLSAMYCNFLSSGLDDDNYY